jgi:hypothetical protein
MLNFPEKYSVMREFSKTIKKAKKSIFLLWVSLPLSLMRPVILYFYRGTISG